MSMVLRTIDAQAPSGAACIRSKYRPVIVTYFGAPRTLRKTLLSSTGQGSTTDHNPNIGASMFGLFFRRRNLGPFRAPLLG